jgi:hypothetical protein
LIERTETDWLERATPEFEHLERATRIDASGRPDLGVSHAMKIFCCALVAFTLAVIAMALGVMLNNRRLTGSCGGSAGLHNESGQPLCGFCDRASEACQVSRSEREQTI